MPEGSNASACRAVVLDPIIPALTYRVGAVFTLAGVVLVGVALVPHPPTVDPFAVEHGLGEINATPSWIIIHWVAAAGFTLWLIGLMTIHLLLREHRRSALSYFSVAATITSLALWLGVMALEAGSMPFLADALANAAGEAEREAVLLVARPLYTLGILEGNMAGFLMWTAVAMWGVDIVRSRALPGWFGWWGVLAGVAGAVALPFSVLFPSTALLLLILTSGPAVLWSLPAGYFLWQAAARVPDKDRLS